MRITYETLNLLATLGDKEAKAASFFCQEYPFREIAAHGTTFSVLAVDMVVPRLSGNLRAHYGI